MQRQEQNEQTANLSTDLEPKWLRKSLSCGDSKSGRVKYTCIATDIAIHLAVCVAIAMYRYPYICALYI